MIERLKIAADKFITLTPCELRTFEAITEGMTNKEIAMKYKISRKTIEVQSQQAIEKLGIERYLFSALALYRMTSLSVCPMCRRPI